MLEDPEQREAIYAFVTENDVIEEMRGLQDPSIRPTLAERPSKLLSNQRPALPTTPRQILPYLLVFIFSLKIEFLSSKEMILKREHIFFLNVHLYSFEVST